MPLTFPPANQKSDVESCAERHPSIKTLAELIIDLEEESLSSRSVRATLWVNFVMRKTSGVQLQVDETITTNALLMLVLAELVQRIDDLEKKGKSNDGT